MSRNEKKQTKKQTREYCRKLTKSKVGPLKRLIKLISTGKTNQGRAVSRTNRTLD